MSLCSENFIEVNGNNLCWYEWGVAQPGQSSILLVHATGFHGRCWDETVRWINRDRQHHIIAVDQRGHGKSSSDGPVAWATMGRDLGAFLQALDIKNLIAVGHSMGGYCLIQAMAESPGYVARAVLIDPVVMEPVYYEVGDVAHDKFLNADGVHPVARRKNSFADGKAMFDNFKGRGSYASWLDASLMDYCAKGGLKPNPEGEGMKLSCDPEFEAAIYMGSTAASPYDFLPAITVPVTILRAKMKDRDSEKMDFSTSPTWEQLATKFPDGRDVYLPELTHFMPMQDPGLVASYILGEA